MVKSKPGLDLESSVVRGEALAIIYVSGTLKLTPCGALLADNGDFFFGFASQTRTSGRVNVITGRGSKLEPIVEGAVALTPGVKIFLSKTQGQVTQTPPTGSGVTIIELGYAISVTEMVLICDPRIRVS